MRRRLTLWLDPVTRDAGREFVAVLRVEDQGRTDSQTGNLVASDHRAQPGLALPQLLEDRLDPFEHRAVARIGKMERCEPAVDLEPGAPSRHFSSLIHIDQARLAQSEVRLEVVGGGDEPVIRHDHDNG
ncbi:MAG TPA: hypothetical protein VM534_10870, partial [Thermoanaerobaculia bacterium]|nr:hypothetical protein [Thermoanaerobaculia bacterium]